MKFKLFFFFSLILTICAFGTYHAATFYVNGSSGNDLWDGREANPLAGVEGPKATIQAAINAASEGDTILVADGTYSGPGNVDIHFAGVTATLKSQNGPDNCIIDCQAAGQSYRAFLFTTDENSLVEGFTLMNGRADAGGALKCGNGSKPTIKNCIIRNNQSRGTSPFENGGGAIYCSGESELTLINCVIVDNASTTRWGGGIYAENACTVNLENCLIAGNRAFNYGGGIYAVGSTEINITNCTIVENSASNFGGAIRTGYPGNVALNVTNSIVWNNTLADPVDKTREISLNGTSTLSLTCCTVKGGFIYDYDNGAFSIKDYGEQNIDLDPGFVEPGAWDANGTPADPSDDFWVEGDYHLQSLSTCRNSGDNDAVDPNDVDLDGNPRIQGVAVNVVDRGAYEMPVPENGPDLTGQFQPGKTTFLDSIVPGDKAAATFSLSNIGNLSAAGVVNLDFYLSDDPYWDDNDTLVSGVDNLKLNLNAGETSQYYTAKIVVPSSISAGNHYLLAVIDPDNAMIEREDDIRSNTFIESATRTVAWKFGDVQGRKNVKLTVFDANNIPVTFSLKGGWGEIAGGAQLSEITLHNTSAKSVLTITTKGKNVLTSIGTIRADSNLRSITAKTTDLRGNIEIAGTLAKLEFRDVTAESPTEHVIQIQGSPLNSGESLSLTFRIVRDLRISSPNLPVKSLICAEWRKSDGLANVIETPWLDKITVNGNLKSNPVIPGDFEADLNLTGSADPGDLILGSVKIVGAIRNAAWDIAGHAGAITAGTLENSSIFIGVKENLPQFNGASGDFSGQYTLQSFAVKGPANPCFTAGQIAAWSIGKLIFPAGAQGDGYIQYHQLSSKQNIPQPGIELIQVP